MQNASFQTIGQVGCAAEANKESRLQCGLNSLGMQAEQLAGLTERAARVANRICGPEPEKPSESKAQGPRPVESHLERFHRIHGDIGSMLERLTRQIARLEENVG